jgi:hypothetical protein
MAELHAEEKTSDFFHGLKRVATSALNVVVGTRSCSWIGSCTCATASPAKAGRFGASELVGVRTCRVVAAQVDDLVAVRRWSTLPGP